MGEEQSTAIEWSKIEEEILCPLCEYNLRGLAEARCPECGYRFEWADLIDPERRRHPYLFEHHPRRKVWAFWRTMVGGVRPRRFWQSLKPAQPSRPGRLVQYAVLVSVIVLLLPVVIVAANGFEIGANGFTRTWIPLDSSEREALQERTIACAGVIVVWPWLTFPILMIFAVSMRRARIRRVHVLRCVVYCGDAGIWAVAGASILVLSSLGTLAWIHPEWDVGWWVVEMALTSVLAMVFAFPIIFAYRLAMAYWYYLKFDHPVGTVISSQIIAVLLTAIVFVLMMGRI